MAKGKNDSTSFRTVATSDLTQKPIDRSAVLKKFIEHIVEYANRFPSEASVHSDLTEETLRRLSRKRFRRVDEVKQVLDADALRIIFAEFYVMLFKSLPENMTIGDKIMFVQELSQEARLIAFEEAGLAA